MYNTKDGVLQIFTKYFLPSKYIFGKEHSNLIKPCVGRKGCYKQARRSLSLVRSTRQAQRRGELILSFLRLEVEDSGKRRNFNNILLNYFELVVLD